MKLKSAVAALALLLSFAVPIGAAAVGNVPLEVGVSDICAAVPLCSYWYAQEARQGITPDMTVTNLGFAPIAVSAVRLPNSTAAIAKIPQTVMPRMSASFRLSESPHSLAAQGRAVKQTVIFTISNGG